MAGITRFAVLALLACGWMCAIMADAEVKKFPNDKLFKAEVAAGGKVESSSFGSDFAMPPLRGPAPKERTAETQVYDGEVRLYDPRIGGASTQGEGILQVYHSGTWRPVCDDLFTIQGARVACRQMGYPIQMANYRTQVYTGTDSFWLDDVTCRGSEGSIGACPHQPYGTENCYASEGIQITCQCIQWPVGSIFLRDVAHNTWSTTNRGVLYIYFNYAWRPVCDDYFSATDARIACQQLGYAGGSYSIGQNAGTTSFWLDDVQCSGNERYLYQCPSAGVGVENCGQYEGVELTCFN